MKKLTLNKPHNKRNEGGLGGFGVSIEHTKAIQLHKKSKSGNNSNTNTTTIFKKHTFCSKQTLQYMVFTF